MSLLREILEKMYQTAVQDADGVRSGRKGYRMRYDEVPDAFEKEIEKLIVKRCMQAKIEVIKNRHLMDRLFALNKEALTPDEMYNLLAEEDEK